MRSRLIGAANGIRDLVVKTGFSSLTSERIKDFTHVFHVTFELVNNLLLRSSSCPGGAGRFCSGILAAGCG